MTNDMSRGNPARLIISFMLPVLAGNIFQQFYNVVDSVIVGQFLGVNALAAVGSTGSVVFLVWGLVTGLTSGFSVILAQQFGAGDKKGLCRYEGASVWLCGVIGILMTVILMLGLNPILRLMNTPDEIFGETRAYLGVLFAGILITFAYNMLAGMLRALGDSKTPLLFLVIASILNIVLDIVFILYCNTGVAGAAYATLIAQAVSALLCVRHIAKKYEILKISRQDIQCSVSSAKKLLNVGIPMGLQFSITAIGTMIVQAALNGLGPVYIAGFSAAGKIGNIATQPFPSLGVAMATYTGQNMGAGRYDRVKKGVSAGFAVCMVCSVITGAAVYLFGPYMMKIFASGDSGQMIEYGVEYLKISAWFYPPLSLIFLYRNTLQGLGDGLVPMLGGVFELAARFGAILVLAEPFGYTGICFSDPAAWVMALIPLVPVYYWRIKKIT
ncbi:MAG: MATE family efflux transporter [Lachnospirales bacterium]